MSSDDESIPEGVEYLTGYDDDRCPPRRRSRGPEPRTGAYDSDDERGGYVPRYASPERDMADRPILNRGLSRESWSSAEGVDEPAPNPPARLSPPRQASPEYESDEPWSVDNGVTQFYSDSDMTSEPERGRPTERDCSWMRDRPRTTSGSSPAASRSPDMNQYYREPSPYDSDSSGYY